jgi:hypothetical protein
MYVFLQIFNYPILITNNSAAIDWTTRNVVFKEILTIKTEYYFSIIMLFIHLSMYS